MKILIAEDDTISRRFLQVFLIKWGHEVVETEDGTEAWNILQSDDAPNLVILDWMMPGMDGPNVCRKVRELPSSGSTYIILLTTKDSTTDIVEGLEAGADDYITKPFDGEELRARVQVGIRILQLQAQLRKQVMELEGALSRVKQLEDLLPVCSYCKKIRAAENSWQEIDRYISQHSKTKFSHTICPDCYQTYATAELDK